MGSTPHLPAGVHDSRPTERCLSNVDPDRCTNGNKSCAEGFLSTDRRAPEPASLPAVGGAPLVGSRGKAPKRTLLFEFVLPRFGPITNAQQRARCPDFFFSDHRLQTEPSSVLCSPSANPIYIFRKIVLIGTVNPITAHRGPIKGQTLPSLSLFPSPRPYLPFSSPHPSLRRHRAGVLPRRRGPPGLHPRRRGPSRGLADGRDPAQSGLPLRARWCVSGRLRPYASWPVAASLCLPWPSARAPLCGSVVAAAGRARAAPRQPGRLAAAPRRRGWPASLPAPVVPNVVAPWVGLAGRRPPPCRLPKMRRMVKKCCYTIFPTFSENVEMLVQSFFEKCWKHVGLFFEKC
jgi:hypothetical protein